MYERKMGRPRLPDADRRVNFSTKISFESREFIDMLQRIHPELSQGRIVDIILKGSDLKTFDKNLKAQSRLNILR